MGDAGLFGKCRLGYMLPGNPIGQGRGGRGGGVLPDALLLEISVKCLDVQGRQVFQLDMTDCGINPGGKAPV